MDNYDTLCLAYFSSSYDTRVERLKHVNDESLQPFRLSEDLELPAGNIKATLPYFLKDEQFCLGRECALTSLFPGLGFHMGRIMWEMLGMHTGEMFVVRDQLNHEMSRFWTLYLNHIEHRGTASHQSGATELQHGKHDSLQDFEHFMQSLPDQSLITVDSICRNLMELKRSLAKNSLGISCVSCIVL